MIEKIVRIDGNPKYGYAKQHIALINDKIYVRSYANDQICVQALYELDEDYIMYCRKHNKLEEVIQLLDLIRPRHEFDPDYNELCNINYLIKQAIKVCDITKEQQKDIGNIKGLSISDW